MLQSRVISSELIDWVSLFLKMAMNKPQVSNECSCFDSVSQDW